MSDTKSSAKIDRFSQLTDTVEVLESLIRNIGLKQALHRIPTEPHLNFWRLIYGNHLDIPVLEWCKLFGADDAERQPIHWKNVATDQEAFKGGLLAAVGLNASEWLAYWEAMKKYRDWNVAHHDPLRRDIPYYPTLDHALNSGFFYFDYVRAELRKFRLDQQPADIRRYARDFEEKCFEIATVAMRSTAGIEETVM